MKFLLPVTNVISAYTFSVSDEETSRWRGLICEIFSPSLFTLALTFILNYRENSQNFK